MHPLSREGSRPQMQETGHERPQDERRTETRSSPTDLHSVELSLSQVQATYQFPLWNLSTQGLCFLVRVGSPVLEHLREGAALDMKFYSGGPAPPRVLRTRIRHLSPSAEGRFRNHTLVGVSILEEPPAAPSP